MSFLPGDRESFWAHLLVEMQHRIRSYVRRTRLSDEEVEEIVWDVWQVAVEHEPELSVPEPWPVLRGIARTLCNEHVGRRRRERVPWGDLGSRESDVLRSSAILSSDALVWLSRAISELPYKQRLVAEYRLLRRLPFRVVAEVIGTSEVTARVHAMRAVARLRHEGRLASQTWRPDDE